MQKVLLLPTHVSILQWGIRNISGSEELSYRELFRLNGLLYESSRSDQNDCKKFKRLFFFNMFGRYWRHISHIYSNPCRFWNVLKLFLFDANKLIRHQHYNPFIKMNDEKSETGTDKACLEACHKPGNELHCVTILLVNTSRAFRICEIC
jgi:hypothetical protein